MEFPTGVGLKLSPNGEHIFYSYNKQREGTDYYDVLVYNIYNIKLGKNISLESNNQYFGYGVYWSKDSTKLFVGSGDRIQIFNPKGEKITEVNVDDPNIQQQRYDDILPRDDLKKYKAYPILRSYYDRLAISPHNNKALVDIEFFPEEPFSLYNRDIYLIDFQTGSTRLLIEYGSSPSWTK